MFSFIAENLATIITGLVVLAIVAAVVVKMIADRRKNKSSGGCGCSCSGCPGAKTCRRG